MGITVVLKNSTGGSISVDIEMTDTPLQVIGKAIQQHGDEAKILMREPKEFNNFKERGIESIQPTESTFAVDGKMGNRALEFNLPIQEQAKAELTEANNNGKRLEFIVTASIFAFGG